MRKNSHIDKYYVPLHYNEEQKLAQEIITHEKLTDTWNIKNIV